MDCLPPGHRHTCGHDLAFVAELCDEKAQQRRGQHHAGRNFQERIVGDVGLQQPSHGSEEKNTDAPSEGDGPNRLDKPLSDRHRSNVVQEDRNKACQKDWPLPSECDHHHDRQKLGFVSELREQRSAG